MQNPVLNQSARQKNVANMLATLRIEKLSPSESLKPSLQAYIEGKKTTTDLLNEVTRENERSNHGHTRNNEADKYFVHWPKL